jgi:hypothetical protein
MTNRDSRPEDVFRAEKERALTVRNSQHARLLAEAKAAFDKLMAEGQAARKSGRPRKHPLPPLKTSSARPPVKPIAPPPALPAKAATPVPVAAPAVAKPAPAKTVKSAAAPAARKAQPAKSASSSKRDGKDAKTKTKTKAKRSTRR